MIIGQDRLYCAGDKEWIETLQRVPHDIYHTPAYHLVPGFGSEGQAYVFVHQESDKLLLWPYLLTPVDGGDDFYDVASAYGYAGPISHSDPAFVQRAWLALCDHWRMQKVVSAFTRFHPILGNQQLIATLPDSQGSKNFAHEKHTKAPEGTTTGVAAGGTIGGALGLLAGIGALAIPGVGPLIAAGPIMGALAGLGVGGAVGGLVGALVGMGIPEYEAKRYEGRLKEGGVLLSVHCGTSEKITRAKEILKRTGAADVASVGEEAVGATATTRDRDRV